MGNYLSNRLCLMPTIDSFLFCSYENKSSEFWLNEHHWLLKSYQVQMMHQKHYNNDSKNKAPLHGLVPQSPISWPQQVPLFWKLHEKQPAHLKQVKWWNDEKLKWWCIAWIVSVLKDSDADQSWPESTTTSIINCICSK